MSKFNVGDRVRVCRGNTIKGRIHWAEDMDKYIGKLLTIARVSDERTYILNPVGLPGSWVFAEEWLELVEGNNLKTKLVKVGTAKTQEECFKALVEGKVLSSRAQSIVRFIDGFLTDKEGNRTPAWNFDGTIQWDILEEQETRWYDNIPEGGILCWVTDRKQPDRYSVNVIVRWNNNSARYYSVTNVPWTYATPLTKAEIQDFMDRL